ncbi:MAG: hypothetical protein JEY91_13345 [Spirochaetaceae bacterium]|nr:hypothetical protein [Spirochaetaceae bacterium]
MKKKIFPKRPVFLFFLIVLSIFASSRNINSESADSITTSRIFIDGENRLIVDDEPFFPIGIYWVKKDAIEEVSKYGFNIVYPFPWEMIPVMENDKWSAFNPQVTMQDYLDEAELWGVKSCFFLDEADRYIFQNLYNGTINYSDLKDAITPYLNHRAFLSYYLMDEPENHMNKMWAQPDFLEEMYNQISEFDKHHPSMVINYNPDVFRLYADVADILLLDLYPIPDGTIDDIGINSDLAAGYTGDDIPIWVTIQAFGTPSQGRRAPSPEELRCMTYNALVHGAKGINFFRYGRPEDRSLDGVHTVEMWNELVNLAGELRNLSPVLLSPYSTKLNTENVESRQFISGGIQYIIAVNTDSMVVKETFPIGNTVNVLYENRTITPNLRSFSDTFQPYEVHIYTLERYISISSPIANDSYDMGERISIKTESGGFPDKVIFYANGSEVDSDSSGSSNSKGVWTPSGSGWYTITAESLYGDGSRITSPEITIAVNETDVVHTWNSWQLEMNSDGNPQARITSNAGAIADIEFYEAIDTKGIGRDHLLDKYTDITHGDRINPVEQYWTSDSSGSDYPYIGKSTILRQNSPPEPQGVHDLLAFPGTDYLVTSFICPVGGEYTLSNLAIRRLADWVYGKDTSVTLRIFGPDMKEKVSITALNDMNWVTDNSEYSIGLLSAGDRIAFALDMDLSSSGDITRFAWTLKMSP